GNAIQLTGDSAGQFSSSQCVAGACDGIEASLTGDARIGTEVEFQIEIEEIWDSIWDAINPWGDDDDESGIDCLR
ncbi:MAG: hypothetical protein QF464_07500, partial [Myxococcota bacterium]|nr:hypothetical protein [Myxococcota bacterium]